jgi:Na+-driven multidrug efflux pump
MPLSQPDVRSDFHFFTRKIKTFSKHLRLFDCVITHMSSADEDLVPEEKPPDPESPPVNSTESVDHSAEAERLGGFPALRTILVLALGPLLSNVTNSLYGIVDSIWIQRAVGDKGMTAISTYNQFEFISRGFGFWLNVAASSTISHLYGSGKGEEAPQLMVDLIRLTVLFGGLAPAICLTPSRATARWLGASEEIVEMGFDYIMPILSCSIVSCNYLLLCGCLQSEGRSGIFGISQITTSLLNMLVFDPLFLFGFHLGNLGASMGTVLSEFLPAVVLATLFFLGKFGTKPTLKMFLRRPSPHLIPALKVGFAQFLSQISVAAPALANRKLLALSTEGGSDEAYNVLMAVFNVQVRIWALIQCVANAANMALIPSASFALGAQRYWRVLNLLRHALWISVVWCLFVMIFLVGFPKLIGRAFSSTPAFLDLIETAFRNSFVLTFLMPAQPLAQGLLQSQRVNLVASLLAIFTQIVPIPLFAGLLYLTDKHNTGRIFWANSMHSAFAFIVAVIFCARPVINLWKMAKANPFVEPEDVKGDVTEYLNSGLEEPEPLEEDNHG